MHSTDSARMKLRARDGRPVWGQVNLTNWFGIKDKSGLRQKVGQLYASGRLILVKGLQLIEVWQ